MLLVVSRVHVRNILISYEKNLVAILTIIKLSQTWIEIYDIRLYSVNVYIKTYTWAQQTIVCQNFSTDCWPHVQLSKDRCSVASILMNIEYGKLLNRQYIFDENMTLSPVYWWIYNND